MKFSLIIPQKCIKSVFVILIQKCAYYVSCFGLLSSEFCHRTLVQIITEVQKEHAASFYKLQCCWSATPRRLGILPMCQEETVTFNSHTMKMQRPVCLRASSYLIEYKVSQLLTSKSKLLLVRNPQISQFISHLFVICQLYSEIIELSLCLLIPLQFMF